MRARSLAFWRKIRVDLAILAGLTALAAVLRLVLLGDFPPGLHGDEAIAGLEARRILDGENIGPYSDLALGVPAGLFYATAAVFALFGESVFTVRLAFAVIGIATVSVSYLAFRVMFTRTIAVIATFLLAVSAWHLYFSRTAFIPIGWPLMQMLTLLLFFLAIQRRSRLLFALAGAALGGGIYTYQAFPIFAAGLGIVIVWLGIAHYRSELRTYIAQIATMLGIALLVGLPMASYAYDHPDQYLSRYRGESVTRADDFDRADFPFEQAWVFVEREAEYLGSLVASPERDHIDGAGAEPFIDWISFALIIGGVLVAVTRVRRPEYAALLILAIVIGLGPAIADGGGYRRTLGLTPLLAAFAAFPLAWVWEAGRRYRGPFAFWSTLVVLVALGGVAAINISRHFGSYDDDPFARFVLAADLAEASEFLDDLPEETYVYFYSERWSINYETRRFIAPDVQGENRSREFGSFDLTPDRSRDVVYLFLEGYLSEAGRVERLFPGGTLVTSVEDGIVEYRAYLLPKLAGAEP